VPDRGSLAECVINISEGQDRPIINAVRDAGATTVLDVHSDPEHNRTVLTLGGPLPVVEEASRLVVTAAVAQIDLRAHAGIHPRFGAADVVPFVPLGQSGTTGSAWDRAVGARDRFAHWAGSTLELPCFLYGPERALPEVRRSAFRSLEPDTGPRVPHPTAGACAVGARPVLIAYNVWIAAGPDPDRSGEQPTALTVARALAGELRSPTVRTLGLAVASGAQVSFNLIEPRTTSVADLYDAVAVGAESTGCSVGRAELVGLLPEVALRAIPRHRWAELDLSEARSIEARLATRGYPMADAGGAEPR
jgi:glutamate formiminotransferase